MRRYAGRLAGALTVPVALWDESYSSADADRLVRESGGRTPRDAAAAAVILQEFLEATKSHSHLVRWSNLLARFLNFCFAFLLFLVPLTALAVLGFVVVSFVGAQLADVPERAEGRAAAAQPSEQDST